MWSKNFLPGMGNKSSGSKSFWLFLLAFSLFSPLALWPQSQPTPPSPQTTLSPQYSNLTREQLLQAINDKDKLLSEWIARGVQWLKDKQQFQTDLANLRQTVDKQTSTIQGLTTSLQDQKQASADQVAARDKLIADQKLVITATTQERDQARKDLAKYKSTDWLEKLADFLGGVVSGFLWGNSSK